MKRVWRVWVASILLAGYDAQSAFQRIEGLDESDFERVVLSQNNPQWMVAASGNALYVSRDGAATFRKTAVFTDERIRHIHIDRQHPSMVYVAGSRRCYRMTHEREPIFSADDGEEIHFITAHDGYLYIATSQGLYYSREELLDWKKAGLQESDVRSVEGFGSQVYAVADSGVYVFSPGRPIRRIFATRGNGDGEQIQPYLLKTDLLTPARLWLSTSKGIFYSPDRGSRWQKFHITGADRISIHYLAQSPLDHNTLYLCSDSGFFKVDIAASLAEPLYEGLATSRVRWVDFSPSGELFLATARGIYRSRSDSPAPTAGLMETLQGEPSIEEVQQAALRYNAVDAEKIASWRRRLKYRALLPRLSVDYDKTIGYSVSSSGEYFGVGPYDWGVNLSWDMGNLIWNSYEDDIDNRSRLTTQLRMDILDEVNRLYFERIRLKHEILAAGRRGEQAVVKELRLHELTATLDGYTGGFFSQQQVKPEL